MIEVSSTLLFISGNLPWPSVMAKFPMRCLLSMKQKRLIIASATVSTPPTILPPPSSSAVQSSPSALNSRKRESFFNLFRDYGFEDSEIQKLSEHTRLGRASVRNLKPKLDCLVEIGFTGKLLRNLIVSSPYILGRGLEGRIKPNLQVLKQYLDSDENVVKAINRFKFILTVNSKLRLIPNIELLINEGVSVDRVSKLLLIHPRLFIKRHDLLVDAVKAVKDFGIAPDAGQFIHCLTVVCNFSESNLRKKLDVFKSFGWSDEQASNVFKRLPSCLALSEENLRSKLGYFLDTLELDLRTLIRNPVLLGLSRKRIRARYEVLKILMSKELIKGKEIPLVSGVQLTEDQFLKKYVVEHEASVPGLLDLYYDILNQKKEEKGQQVD